jgi:hypothetical protein
MRSIHRKEIDQAEKELLALKKVREKQNTYLAEHNDADKSYGDRAGILEKQLNAMILIASGKTEEGVRLLQEAAVTEESLPMAFGPPFIDKPTRELLGEVLCSIVAEAASALKQP